MSQLIETANVNNNNRAKNAAMVDTTGVKIADISIETTGPKIADINWDKWSKDHWY